jgi:adenosylhomocysteine nucleosidase
MKSEVRRAKGEALICFAVKEEVTEFGKVLRDFPDTTVLVTGMGKKNSENSFRETLEKSEPRLVLTCGFAGALNPDFKIGDVIFSTNDLALGNLLRESGAVPAKFFCADRVAITALEKEKLRHKTNADAVEMESEIIHTICREREISCATVRVISDVANEDLPLDFNALMTHEQKISLGKLAVALTKSPKTIPRLLQLQRNTRLGARRLSEILEKLLRAW